MRIPRPIGLTLTIRDEMRDNSSQLNQYSKAIRLICQTYTMQGGKINNEYISIEELANWLSLPIIQVMRITNESYANMAKIVGGNNDDAETARGVIFQGLNWGLETRALAAQQVALLMASQGSEYVPFISAEVNRSIVNLLAANKPLVDIAKVLFEANKASITINNNTDASINQTNNYITAEQANIQMQANPNSPMNSSEALKALEQRERQLGLPEVDARIQGMNSEALALDPALISANRAKKNKLKANQANPIIIGRNEVHHTDTTAPLVDEGIFTG